MRRLGNVSLAMGCLVILLAVTTAWAPAQSGGHSLRVVTYNIRHGQGMDNEVNLRRTGEVLQRLNPDIVALQEVDQLVERSGGVDQAKALAAQLGLQATFGPFMEYQGGKYGMAILSRYPILKTRIVQLPEGNEPRIALGAELQLPDSSQLLVVNVHFDWVRDDRFRWAQAQAVKQMLDTWPTPYLLLGDFNDQPESRTVRMLAEGLKEATKPENDPMTFSSTRPEREIDYIFAGPAARWSVRQVEVIREPMASDHRPVLATMNLK